MPINYIDLIDVIEAGERRVDDFLDEWSEQFTEPLMKIVQMIQAEQAVIMWQRIPPELHEQIKKQSPEQYAQAEKVIRQLAKGV